MYGLVSSFLPSYILISHLTPSFTDGRFEDGYIAWSSIYLHEYFGCTIYTPLTPEEEQELKEPDGEIPKWMYKYTSLPNIAIFMSYFCIGVALQLLRTPLIVYFIEDLNATPAEVNVLFTGKNVRRNRTFLPSPCNSHVLLLFVLSHGCPMVFQGHLRLSQ
jgi:hypothetical protein